jgi:hypothetical protein
MSLLHHGSRDALHRHVGSVLGGCTVVDLHDDVLALHHLADDGVLGRGGLVEEIEEGVVHAVDEELLRFIYFLNFLLTLRLLYVYFMAVVARSICCRPLG